MTLPGAAASPTDDDASLHEIGSALRRTVMGDEHVDRALQITEGTVSSALQDHITRHLWGAVWARPGLDRRSRSLLNLGILVSGGFHDELAGHVRGGLTNGLTREEIIEAVIHTAGYCGAPSALAAMRTVQRVFGELDEAPAPHLR